MVNGFDKKIAGDDYSYHSSIPEIKKSLIVRTTHCNYSMRWQTKAAPLQGAEKYIIFAWLAGIGSSPGLSDMILTINNNEQIVFHTDGQKDWKVQVANGSELFFSFGYGRSVWIHVPAYLYAYGSSLFKLSWQENIICNFVQLSKQGIEL